MPERDDLLVPGALAPLPVLGVIFAGGASRRYGRDKALARLGGVTLLERVIDRVRPQVDVLAISGSVREGFALPVIADDVKLGGPLTALRSVLVWAEGRDLPLVATFSCDTPFLPGDLVARLRAVLADGRDCAFASWGAEAQPTCALWRTAARLKVETAFEAGVRSLVGAMDCVNASAAEIAGEGPQGNPFFNINCEADLAVAQAWRGGQSR